MTGSWRFLVLAAAVLALLPTGCAKDQRTIMMTPSLAPVDMSRPIVRYQPIQGRSCTSMRDAIWDMKRLVGVDGYVEVSVEGSGCWVATGYPYTYGTQPKPLFVRERSSMPRAATGSEVPERSRPATAGSSSSSAPRRTASSRRSSSSRSMGSSSSSTPTPRRRARPSPAPTRTLNRSTCEPACRSFGRHAGATALIQRVVADRCISRCMGGDATYYDCVKDTRDVTDVKRCNGK